MCKLACLRLELLRLERHTTNCSYCAQSCLKQGHSRLPLSGQPTLQSRNQHFFRASESIEGDARRSAVTAQVDALVWALVGPFFPIARTALGATRDCLTGIFQVKAVSYATISHDDGLRQSPVRIMAKIGVATSKPERKGLIIMLGSSGPYCRRGLGGRRR